MMAATPPNEGGVASDSRVAVEESMEVEQALSAHALLSGEEEGEVHSDVESRLEAGSQELFSFNAPVESGAGRNEQAQVGAVAPVHAVPFSGGMAADRQARGVAIDGVGRVLLEESVELRGVDLPQSREDSAQLHRNLVLAYPCVALNAQRVDAPIK